MDGQQFDRLARAVASGVNRRQVIRTFSGSLGAGLLASSGFLSRFGRASAQDEPELLEPPTLTFEGLTAEFELRVDQVVDCAIEYSTKKTDFETAAGGFLTVASEKPSSEHEIKLKSLLPDTKYYFRIRLSLPDADDPGSPSKLHTFTTPGCPEGSVQCGSTCVANCGPGASLDQSTCACICEPGFGDCDGDPANGCETQLDSIDNCLACGNRCDDGNACTNDICDPVNGCVSVPVEDGAPCGVGGTCQAGVCANCVAGGICAVDADCCDDEICCGGVCVNRALLLDDVNNCGGCGVACEPGPCETAICLEGQCQYSPVVDGEPCDDGNECTVDDHCMAGQCMGTPVEDGAECESGLCQEGACQECSPGGTCESDDACCSGEICCDGTCVPETSFAEDPENCGGCGVTCEAADDCLEAICRDGTCETTPVEDGTECGELGLCKEGVCEEQIPSEPLVIGPIFEDDFESGSLQKWSSAKGFDVQQSFVARGEYGGRAKSTGAGSYVRRTLGSALSEVYFRTRFQVVSQGKNTVYLMRAFKSASSPLLSAGVSSSGKLLTHNSVTGATTTSKTSVPLNTWHEIQVRAKVAGTRSVIEVWFNGTRISDLSKTADLGRAGIYSGQIGDNVANRAYEVAFDDVAFCTGGVCPKLPEVQSPGTSTAPGANQRVLLKTYTHNSSGGIGWSKIKYRPRQFRKGLVVEDATWGSITVDNPGVYDRWDVLNSFNASVHRIEKRADWLVIELNRAATLAVVWRWGSAVPSWLASWTKSSTVVLSGKTWTTYRKSFSAGKVTLGGVYSPTDSPGNATRDTYWVLFAEQDALPSPAPVVPTGMQAPLPNDTCPAWVHDRYTAVGPDGKVYPTWHHQIDPIYWCYHRHEHGSNPAWFDSKTKPLFGYTCGAHGMTEPHQGYKNFVLDSDDGTRWMITHHFGTSGLGRACTRHHTTDIVVKSIATGELLADLHIMGDFGKSVVNSTNVALTPPTCPDQAALAKDSYGIRKLPSQADGPTFYEPWRVDYSKTVFGFIASFTINNPDAVVICNNSTCDQPVTTSNTGSKRFFTPNGDDKGVRFGIIAGKNSGTFYTDVYGTKVVTSGTHGAVRQYIKPGAKMQIIHSGIHYYDLYAWGKKFVGNVKDANPTDREGSIRTPN